MMDLSFNSPWKSSNVPEDPDPFIPMHVYWAQSLVSWAVGGGLGGKGDGGRIMRKGRGLWWHGPGISAACGKIWA